MPASPSTARRCSTKGQFGSPLYATPISGGEDDQVLPFGAIGGCFPARDGIYYYGMQSPKGYVPLEFYDFSTKSSRMLTKLDPTSWGLTVLPDEKTFLYVSADLMMIENFP
jgi:hypothetical protein